MKKLLITAAAAAIVFGGAAGVFAHSKNYDPKPTPAPLPVTVVSNYGGVNNTAVNVANTGANYTTGSLPVVLKLDTKHGHGKNDPQQPVVSVTTGAAYASQTISNGINTVATCGCSTAGNTTVLNGGSVSNLSVNVANTGLNWTTGGSVTTGAATAGQDVSNIINTSVGAAM